MAIERTLSIVKPDAVAAGNIGNILAIFEKNGLKIVAGKLMHLTPEKAGQFYGVHRERPFFQSLVDFMCSGPCFVSVLEGEDAIKKNRTLMGATDPAKADAGTIRKLYASNIEKNAAHGSDAPETAKFEISHFFSGLELNDYKRS